MLLRNARLGEALVDILLTDGRIASVVPAAAGAGPGSHGEIVDIDGRWVIPGLWDNHTHFDQWALHSARLDVSAARSAAETAHLVAVADRGARPVFVATGFRDALWPDAPSRSLLDAASSSPVVVISGDLHATWLNSAALAAFGHPFHENGLLRENDAFAVVAQLDASTDAERDAMAQQAATRAASRGVVGIVDYEMSDNGRAWQRRAESTPLRVEFGIYRQHLDAAIERGYRTGALLQGTDRVRVGNLKIIIDGSLNTRTAWCFDSYPGLVGDAAYGMLTVQPEELLNLITRAATAGIGASVHAIGDRAISIALDAFALLAADLDGRRLTGNRIEHAQLVAESDLARFFQLDVAASVQPDHATDDRDVADHYWAGRTARAFPLRSLLDAGARLMFGSDAPVARLDPLMAIEVAVRRSRGEREPWHPEQAISVDEAIRASVRSRVAVDEPADLVLLDGDPALIGGGNGGTPGVDGTILAGGFTHRGF